MNVYVVFSGTTDHRHRLFQFMHGNVSGFTALQSAGCWQGILLGGDVLVFFDKQDAIKVAKFLLEECHQQSAPIYSINAAEVSIQCA